MRNFCYVLVMVIVLSAGWETLTSLPGVHAEEASVHPGDLNMDWRMTMSEAITYLYHWQRGTNLMSYAIRAAYLWQNGEYYYYNDDEAPPHCWVLNAPEGEIEGELESVTIILPGEVPLEFVRVPSGQLQMGSPTTERSRNSDESPIHTVTMDYDFFMGKYEVTQAQWLALMSSWPGAEPSVEYGLGESYPAYYVSWNDTAAFISAINTYLAASGQGTVTMRLPSEAEWEYACRAGTQERYCFGDSMSVLDECDDDILRGQYMWYCGNNPDYGQPGHGVKPVGDKLPNVFGLYDMHGNVWEWCQDWYHSTYNDAPDNGSAWELPEGSDRVLRGGYWNNHAGSCRSANRYNRSPGYSNNSVGFRLVFVP